MVMLYIILFFLELIALFFFSRRVQKKLGTYLYGLTKNKKISIYFMAFLFLPGTFVHEMSHFLSALFLLVPVGKMELIPVIEKDSVKLGSVGIAKTDIIRRFLIGSAPFTIGTLVILTLSNQLFVNFNIEWGMKPLDLAVLFLGAYLVFTISNTMFASKKDLEGMWGFVAIIAISAVTFWIFNINLNLSFLSEIGLREIFSRASMLLLIPLIIDIIALIYLKI